MRKIHLSSVLFMIHMQCKGLKIIIGKTAAAGFLALLYLGWTPSALAVPVITNMPHRADGTRITGSQPVPKAMPGDVAVKPKPPASGTANKPATPAAQTAPKQTPAPPAVKTEAASGTANKPATPAAQTAPKQTPAPPAVKTEAPKPAAPPQKSVPKAETATPAAPAAQTVPKQTSTQPAVKTEAPKPAAPPQKSVPKPATPAAQTIPKPAVKTAPAAPAKKEKAKKQAKQEREKSVYQVGDKGWKVKQAQQYLQKLGYDPGGTDGKFTKTTRKSIRQFQKKYKLKETGNLDNATYQELKWQAEAKDYGGNVASTKILKTAAQYKGVPYVFGGTTPNGFDCSGYVQYVFAKHGIRLTRTADTQALEGKFVSKKSLRPGDLVFFTTYEPGASHVGIYAGNGQFWNATSSRGIMLSNLNDSYWGPRYYTARRILAEK